MITLDRVEVECGLVWFGLVWWRFTVFEVDGLVSYITVISPFSFSDRSLRVLVQVLFCRFRSSLSHLFYCSLLTFFSLSLLSFFFLFHFFPFFFHVLALALVASLCALYKVYLYIPRAFFFTSFLYLFSLPPFFFPLSLSLSLSVTRSLCIFRYLNNIHANEQNKIESRSEYARSAVSPCSRFTLF